MNKARFISFASVISEIQQSDLFMTVKARILETPKANLNGASVTEDFVDDIIANEERYVGLPLYADVNALKSGKYNRLGHLYDSRTGEFHSTQIGSFYQFEKEEFDGGAYLVGYARIPKRDKAISRAIAELFTDGALKFSFEIACVDYKELEDGTFVIYASENNYLEGTAIVTFPACEDAVALEFVAQREADDTRKGDLEMAEVEKLVAEETEATPVEIEATETEQTEAEIAEVESVEKTEAAEEAEAVDETAACKDEEKAEEETACSDKKVADEETAEACEHEEVAESDEGNVVESDEGTTIAEEVVAEDGEGGETQQGSGEAGNSGETGNSSETGSSGDSGSGSNDSGGSGGDSGAGAQQDPEPAAEEVVLPGEPAKKTAEEMIAELAETVKALSEEVASLKEQRVVASQTVTAEVNPFIDTIVAEGSTYDLLKPVAKRTTYTLI